MLLNDIGDVFRNCWYVLLYVPALNGRKQQHPISRHFCICFVCLFFPRSDAIPRAADLRRSGIRLNTLQIQQRRIFWIVLLMCLNRTQHVKANLLLQLHLQVTTCCSHFALFCSNCVRFNSAARCLSPITSPICTRCTKSVFVILFDSRRCTNPAKRLFPQCFCTKGCRKRFDCCRR